MENNKITSEEAKLLFNRLCEETEKGREDSKALLDECEKAIEMPDVPDADIVIKRAYVRLEKLNAPPKKVRPRKLLRHCFIAAAAMLTFVLTSFFTASALESNIIESVKIVWEDAAKSNGSVKFIDYNGHDVEVEKYNNLSKLFKSVFEGCIYPDGLTANAMDIRVIRREGSERIFVLEFYDAKGKKWRIIGEPSEEIALPAGYAYSADCKCGELDFVYTVSRNGSKITRYTVHTIHNGVKYTFYCETGNWEQVKLILDSMT